MCAGHNFAPVERMVEEELVSGVEYLACEKERRLCESPVSPKGSVNTEKLDSFCSFLKCDDIPWIDLPAQILYLSKCDVTRSWVSKVGFSKLRHVCHCYRRRVFGYACNKLLLWKVGDV